MLRFVDATPDPLVPADPERRVRAMALGAQLDLEVQGGPERDEARAIEWAVIDDPSRVDVEVRDGTVHLTALELGDVRLEVGTTSSEEDALSLEVRELSTTQIVVGDFPMLAEFAGVFDDSEPYDFALTPGARALATARMLDEAGEPLSGYGLASWTVEPSTQGATLEARSPRADAVDLVAGPGGETLELVLEDGPRRSWPVRDLGDVASIEWWLDDTPLAADETLQLGQSALFIGLARDTEGLALVPSTTSQLRVEVSKDVGALVVREDELLDVVQVEAVALGAVDLTISMLGQQTTTRLQIIP